MSPDEARAFVASNHRAVLITRRPGEGLQTSPVLVGWTANRFRCPEQHEQRVLVRVSIDTAGPSHAH
jgi:hypothetical protein